MLQANAAKQALLREVRERESTTAKRTQEAAAAEAKANRLRSEVEAAQKQLFESRLAKLKPELDRKAKLAADIEKVRGCVQQESALLASWGRGECLAGMCY